MLWLAIDTSGGTTVGVVRTLDGGAPELLAGATSPDARGHVETLAPMLRDVVGDAGLTVADLDAIAVGTGPAPFTGLRVGLASAAAFARATETPIHGVCSLDAIAWGRAGDLVVASDARRREIYWAAYRGAADGGVPVRAHGPAVGPPSEALDWIATHGGAVVGPAAALYPELEGDIAEVSPVGLVAVAAEAVRRGDPTPLTPLYLRRPDIHVGGGRKRAT